MPPGPLYTTPEAARLATGWRRSLTAGASTVRPGTIRSWAARGHLEPRGLTEAGHPLYALADLAAAELATRARALRLAGISGCDVART